MDLVYGDGDESQVQSWPSKIEGTRSLCPINTVITEVHGIMIMNIDFPLLVAYPDLIIYHWFGEALVSASLKSIT